MTKELFVWTQNAHVGRCTSPRGSARGCRITCAVDEWSASEVRGWKRGAVQLEQIEPTAHPVQSHAFENAKAFFARLCACECPDVVIWSFLDLAADKRFQLCLNSSPWQLMTGKHSTQDAEKNSSANPPKFIASSFDEMIRIDLSSVGHDESVSAVLLALRCPWLNALKSAFSLHINSHFSQQKNKPLHSSTKPHFAEMCREVTSSRLHSSTTKIQLSLRAFLSKEASTHRIKRQNHQQQRLLSTHKNNCVSNADLKEQNPKKSGQKVALSCQNINTRVVPSSVESRLAVGRLQQLLPFVAPWYTGRTCNKQLKYESCTVCLIQVLFMDKECWNKENKGN